MRKQIGKNLQKHALVFLILNICLRLIFAFEEQWAFYGDLNVFAPDLFSSARAAFLVWFVLGIFLAWLLYRLFLRYGKTVERCEGEIPGGDTDCPDHVRRFNKQLRVSAVVLFILGLLISILCALMFGWEFYGVTDSGYYPVHYVFQPAAFFRFAAGGPLVSFLIYLSVMGFEKIITCKKSGDRSAVREGGRYRALAVVLLISGLILHAFFMWYLLYGVSFADIPLSLAVVLLFSGPVIWYLVYLFVKGYGILREDSGMPSSSVKREVRIYRNTGTGIQKSMKVLLAVNLAVSVALSVWLGWHRYRNGDYELVAEFRPAVFFPIIILGPALSWLEYFLLTKYGKAVERCEKEEPSGQTDGSKPVRIFAIVYTVWTLVLTVLLTVWLGWDRYAVDGGSNGVYADFEPVRFFACLIGGLLLCCLRWLLTMGYAKITGHYERILSQASPAGKTTAGRTMRAVAVLVLLLTVAAAAWYTVTMQLFDIPEMLILLVIILAMKCWRNYLLFAGLGTVIDGRKQERMLRSSPEPAA